MVQFCSRLVSPDLLVGLQRDGGEEMLVAEA